MINLGEREVKKVYSRNREGRWQVASFCREPTVTMVDIDTGRKVNFGLGGLLDKEFEPLRDATPDDLEDYFRVMGIPD